LFFLRSRSHCCFFPFDSAIFLLHRCGNFQIPFLLFFWPSPRFPVLVRRWLRLFPDPFTRSSFPPPNRVQKGRTISHLCPPNPCTNHDSSRLSFRPLPDLISPPGTNGTRQFVLHLQRSFPHGAGIGLQKLSPQGPSGIVQVFLPSRLVFPGSY